MYLRPPRLPAGGTIGIIAPSSGVERFPRRVARALSCLTKAGYSFTWSRSTGQESDTDTLQSEVIASDFNRLIADSSVDAVMAATGGYTANSMLPFVDYALFNNRPRIVCGYSDTSVLLVALTSLARVCTFYGASLLPTFGEYGGVFEYSLASFRKLTGSDSSNLELLSPAVTTHEYSHWDRDDAHPRQSTPAGPWRCIRKGRACGHAFAVSVEGLCRLLGTPFCPVLDGAILFLDEDNPDPFLFKARLTQLLQAGVAANIRGVVLARLPTSNMAVQQQIAAVLGAFANDLDIPALCDVDFGHTDPRLTIPLGVEVSLDSDASRILLLQTAVL